jgi:hypothetical protein
MDVESQAKFDEIVKKDPAALAPGEIDFLRARRSYLNEEQRATFASVLGVQDESATGSDSDSDKDSEATTTEAGSDSDSE